MDIHTASPCRHRIDLTCYTFGAPRTGNHVFAKEFNEKVPDAWSIINDQDTVTRTGKFLYLYKRPGQRVLINSSGDMIVRPSFIEASMQRASTSSLPQHLLASYQRAHVAIIKAQFTQKRLRNGTSGIIRIAEACGMQSLLKAAGIDTGHLRTLHRLTDGVIPNALLGPIARACPKAYPKTMCSRESSVTVDYDLATIAKAVIANSPGKEAAATSAAIERLEDAKESIPESPYNVTLTRHHSREAIASQPRRPSLPSQQEEQPHSRPPEPEPHKGSVPEAETGAPVGPGAARQHGISSNSSSSSSSASGSPAKLSDAPDMTSAASVGSPAVHNGDAPLQTYGGCLVEQSGISKHARYTHFNGRKCPFGGTAVQNQTGKCQFNFCRQKNQSKEALVDEDRGEAMLRDRPTNILDKGSNFACEAARRFIGR